MKTILTIFAVTLAISSISASPAAIAQNTDHSSMNMSSQSEQVSVKESEIYVCPMHPHIHGENGDNCPICGMALVPAKTSDEIPVNSDISADDLKGSHRVNPDLMQTIGVKTAAVKLEVFGDDLRAYGRVVPSSRIENQVTLRIEGWVEDLAASAVGDVIEKGQRLFNLNSPQLISAQTDYLTALKLGNNDIAKAAESRMRQLGVDDKAIELIKSQDKALTSVPFYATSSGVVTNLNIRTGDYIKPAMPLLAIQDLSTVWVEADVPERDISNLKMGDRVMIHLSEIGKKRLGKITYIQPTMDPTTRTGQVRIELKNPNGDLKPDSFVDVIFTAEKRHRLAVPTQAVLRSSMGDYVLRYLGDGRFKPVMIRTGAKSNEFIEVKSGLEKGQQIVTSGQFLLDAEASLKSGMGSMSGHNHGDMPAKEASQGNNSTQEVNPHAGH